MKLEKTTQEYLQLIAKTIVNQADNAVSLDALIGELGGRLGVVKAGYLLKTDLDTPDQLDKIHIFFKNVVIQAEFGDELPFSRPLAIL